MDPRPYPPSVDAYPIMFYEGTKSEEYFSEIFLPHKNAALAWADRAAAPSLGHLVRAPWGWLAA